MTPTEALAYIEKESIKVIEEEALGFKADLVLASPVDTGAFRSAWAITKITKLHWQISNRMDYASYLWGRLV